MWFSGIFCLVAILIVMATSVFSFSARAGRATVAFFFHDRIYLPDTLFSFRLASSVASAAANVISKRACFGAGEFILAITFHGSWLILPIFPIQGAIGEQKNISSMILAQKSLRAVVVLCLER